LGIFCFLSSAAPLDSNEQGKKQQKSILPPHPPPPPDASKLMVSQSQHFISSYQFYFTDILSFLLNTNYQRNAIF
jgi:hypothetical protein